jgi:hypothetical protein
MIDRIDFEGVAPGRGEQVGPVDYTSKKKAEKTEPQLPIKETEEVNAIRAGTSKFAELSKTEYYEEFEEYYGTVQQAQMKERTKVGLRGYMKELKAGENREINGQLIEVVGNSSIQLRISGKDLASFELKEGQVARVNGQNVRSAAGNPVKISLTPEGASINLGALESVRLDNSLIVAGEEGFGFKI